MESERKRTGLQEHCKKHCKSTAKSRQEHARALHPELDEITLLRSHLRFPLPTAKSLSCQAQPSAAKRIYGQVKSAKAIRLQLPISHFPNNILPLLLSFSLTLLSPTSEPTSLVVLASLPAHLQHHDHRLSLPSISNDLNCNHLILTVIAVHFSVPPLCFIVAIFLHILFLHQLAFQTVT